MASDNEPAKLLLPYLQRADELQKHEPLVAYYCRLYAMERGLKIPKSDRTKTTEAILVSLIKQLEKDKKSLNLNPDDQLHIEGFALNVFNKADKQDRAGRADKNTAKTFYAASIFFEILNQFGEVQPDLEQKQRYAAWKAADIRKALNEGRTPLPGPPGGEKDLSVPSNKPVIDYDLEQRTNPFSKPGIDTDYPPEPRNDQSVMKPTYGTDPSPQVNDTSSFHHSQDNITSPPYNNITSPPYNNITSPPNNLPTSPQYPTNDHAQNFHQPPNDPSENSYSHPYHHQQSFQQEHHFPSHETPLYLYPNFQSYPIAPESSLPPYSSSAPSQHYPSYQQGPLESGYPTTPPHAPTSAKYGEYETGGRNGIVAEANLSPPPAAASNTFNYDSNYMPSPEKIAEAHKAARFAVGALAFDDVPTAVDHLKKSLELLTKGH